MQTVNSSRSTVQKPRKGLPAPYVYEHGDGWEIWRMPETADFDLKVGGEYCGSFGSAQEARTVRNAIMYDQAELEGRTR